MNLHLSNGEVYKIHDENDFTQLLYEYLGMDAVDYFNEQLEENCAENVDTEMALRSALDDLEMQEEANIDIISVLNEVIDGIEDLKEEDLEDLPEAIDKLLSEALKLGGEYL